ncbi:hypothetical protein NEOLEDRAFT_1151266 [Neolentinus lepideus HHB14362 ss-1]|uniref:Transmembrane protein n=1 Tax=Neolentinus lepideus HHB14362 ss-1 TaxID=1314782 RepID=A0A165P6L2_9AGAM|nr:hypothetical protein NEOLEDRAFT_1151266 [Neolentinus lepideus HHB14362 ss-1]
MYAPTTTTSIAVDGSSAPREPEGVNTGVAIFMGILFMTLVITFFSKYWTTCFPSYDIQSRQTARAHRVYRVQALSKGKALKYQLVGGKSEETGIWMNKLSSVFSRVIRKSPSDAAVKNEVLEVETENRRTWKERWSLACTWLAQSNLAIRCFLAGVENCVLRALRIRPTVTLTLPSGAAILPLPSTVMSVDHDVMSEIAPQDPRRLTGMSWIDRLWAHQEEADEQVEAEMESNGESDNEVGGEASTLFIGSFLPHVDFVSQWVIGATSIAHSARKSVLGGDVVLPAAVLPTIAKEEEEGEAASAMPDTLPDTSITTFDDDKTRIGDHSFLEEADITAELTMTEGRCPSAKDERKVLPSVSSADITDILLHYTAPNSFALNTSLEKDAVLFTPRPHDLLQVEIEEKVACHDIPQIFVGRRNLFTPMMSSPTDRMPRQEDWI